MSVYVIQICVQTLKHLHGPELLSTSFLVSSTFIPQLAWKLGGKRNSLQLCPSATAQINTPYPLTNGNTQWRGWGTKRATHK